MYTHTHTQNYSDLWRDPNNTQMSSDQYIHVRKLLIWRRHHPKELEGIIIRVPRRCRIVLVFTGQTGKPHHLEGSE